MNIKKFLLEIKALDDLLNEKNTFSNRWKIRKAKKRVMQMMKDQAQKYADIVYKQSMDTAIDLANANLSKNIF